MPRVLEHHRRWRGFRAQLRALAATVPSVRRFRRAEGRRQLALVAHHPGGRRAREEDALLLFTMERVCDAISDGEARALGLSEERLIELLVARL